MQALRQIDWPAVKSNGQRLLVKMIRTKDPFEAEASHALPVPGRSRLQRCLSTFDLVSLGVGSCVGTGMYLVAGMVAHKYAGPGVIFSFMIAAVASLFSGACYAEFGVRVPHTTGSAYMYTYVTVGEFIAFVIGWNMVLEYLIGTSACARALSACIDSIFDKSISKFFEATFGLWFGKPLDFLACGITLAMMMVLIAGVKKSMAFTNILNGINLCIWVFMISAGLFYVDFSNWTKKDGFLPYGWKGVFEGAATCFYAFIGFDIIATTGEEAMQPQKSIPIAIVVSLTIILGAYVSSSSVLTLVVPHEKVDSDSALIQMFAYVGAPTCKYIVAIGALAGLTVSMFGSMFPMPRVIYAMAQDGLLFKGMSELSERTGTPAYATIIGGVAAAFVALVVQLEILVEMMSIGTLLAYTLVSSCVLVLRYQPNSTNLIELLPQSIRTPMVDTPGATDANKILPVDAASGQKITVRRITTRGSPDSDDSVMGDNSEEYGRDDSYLVSDRTENKFYGSVPGSNTSTSSPSACSRFVRAINDKLQSFSYLCPSVFPWVDLGPANTNSGMFVLRSVGIMFGMMFLFDLFAAYGSPSTSGFTCFIMVALFLSILFTLILISRKPQNRVSLIYATPCLPFVPSIAVMVNVYLILNLNVLTLLRFTVWMSLGLVLYFKYGIRHSTLNATPIPTPTPRATPSVLDRTHIPASPRVQPSKDKTIYENDGDTDGGSSLYREDSFSHPLLVWHDSKLSTNQAHSSPFMQLEQRYDEETHKTTSHASFGRPPWAFSDAVNYGDWDD